MKDVRAPPLSRKGKYFWVGIEKGGFEEAEIKRNDEQKEVALLGKGRRDTRNKGTKKHHKWARTKATEIK